MLEEKADWIEAEGDQEFGLDIEVKIAEMSVGSCRYKYRA